MCICEICGFIHFENPLNGGVNSEDRMEVKANEEGIAEVAIAQILNYLEAPGLKLALIINFGKTGLAYKRLVY